MILRNFRRWMRMMMTWKTWNRAKSAPGSMVFSRDLVLFEMPSFGVNELRSIVGAAQRSLAEAGAVACKSCDKARVCNDQESWNLAITRSRAERKGMYGLEGKESGSRFGSSEDKVSLPGLKHPNWVPGFSCVVQVPKDVLVKQSTSHPDCPGEASLNLASGAALDLSPLEIISNNGGVKHVSTESELVKEAFSDPCFLKQVRGLEAMLRVRAGRCVSPGSADTAAAGAST